MEAKSLIVFFSRGGITEIVANELKNISGFDIDKIIYTNGKRPSAIAAVAEAVRKKTTLFSGDEHDPINYSEIIFLSPVWGSALSTPIRSYMKAYSGKISSYSIICTMSSSGSDNLFNESSLILGKPPKFKLAVRSSDVKNKTLDYRELFKAIL